MSNFEERLLQELRTVVAEQPAERGQPSRASRRPRLVLAGGLVAAVAVAASRSAAAYEMQWITKRRTCPTRNVRVPMFTAFLEHRVPPRAFENRI